MGVIINVKTEVRSHSIVIKQRGNWKSAAAVRQPLKKITCRNQPVSSQRHAQSDRPVHDSHEKRIRKPEDRMFPRANLQKRRGRVIRRPTASAGVRKKKHDYRLHGHSDRERNDPKEQLQVRKPGPEENKTWSSG